MIDSDVKTQQTFVLMKTFWKRLSSSSSEDVLIKTNIFTLHLTTTNIFVLVIRLQDVFKTSSGRLQRRLAKTSLRHLQDVSKTFQRRVQDVFKTSSRYLAKTFSRRLQNVFKTSCKNILKTCSRRLQDLFKTHHRVKLLLLRRFQDIF